MPNRYELVGPTALVTGAGMGIGLATASVLADSGARVILHSRTQAEAEEAVRSVPRSVPVWGDLADAAARDALADRVTQAVGDSGERLDILVHNAGIYPEATLETETLEAYRRVMAINVESQWHLTKRLLPLLIASGSAGGTSIVHVSSIVIKLPLGDSPAYTASKAAQVGLARHLAAELGKHNIRVNLVLPGHIDTPGARAQLGEQPAQAALDRSAREFQLIHVHLKPDDIAHAIAFLCSTAARGITAAAIDVNGGWRVGG
jgi:NAD(P)-dependent dehydrogenase (short-subunit alcohol dehydrogenase family)